MHLIRYLSSSDDNRLTVIEKKQERCKEASTNSDATILNADGSKPDVLKLAETSQADIGIVTTDDDRVTLASRDSSYVFPEAELELKSGDKVLLLGDAPSVARTVELLRSSETA